MLFNSFEFALFLPVVLAAYWSLRNAPRWQNVLLLVASYVFYGYWDWRFLSLIGFSTLVDYTVGIQLHAELQRSEGHKTRAARRWLLTSLVCNLGLLGFFKYFNFFSGSFSALLAQVGVEADPFYLNIVLPVGISFYTFQTLSYTIDIYRGQMKPTRDLVTFAVYVAFFPQLVAGPIERARVLLPQLMERRKLDWVQMSDGAHLIFWGLFKKVFVADNLAPYVNQIFASPDPTTFEVVVAAYAFAFQIYCDFSGYSDVARGCAKCMGIELMVNFRYPYVATSPSDFWRRWHISLSTWLRDYLYIPLGGNRMGGWMTYRNLALTMLLGGLWHGSTWLFVVWGAYQGLLLIVHRLTADHLPRAPSEGFGGRLATFVKVVVLFQFVCGGWLIFRAESIGQLWTMTTALVVWTGSIDWSVAWPLVQFALPLCLLEGLLGLSKTDELHRVRWLPSYVLAAIYAVLFYLLVFRGAAAQTFIYFQF